MAYLLALTIGPVQDFIASARRSRDLWFGSWLLSELSKAAAKQIGKDKLIFPAIEKDEYLAEDSEFKVVNKISTVVDGDAKTLCDQTIKKVIDNRLNCPRDEAFRQFAGNPSFLKTVAEEQLKDLVEFYWAGSRFNNEREYINARNKVEKLITARKATQDSKAVRWQTIDQIRHALKSSLDGQRESVIDERVYERFDRINLSDRRKAALQKTLRLRYEVRIEERLCRVGLLKRRGKPHKNAQGIDSFFSPSHVAALPLLNRLNDKAAIKDYLTERTKPDLLGIIDDQKIKAYLGHLHPKATRTPHEYFCNEEGSSLYDGYLLCKERLLEVFPDKDKRQVAEKCFAKFFGNGSGQSNAFTLLRNFARFC